MKKLFFVIITVVIAMLFATFQARSNGDEYPPALTITEIQEITGENDHVEEIYETYMEWRGQRKSCRVIDLRGYPSYMHNSLTMVWEAEYARNHGSWNNHRCPRC